VSTAETCLLTAVKVIAASSPVYKLTFFSIDHQANLSHTYIITVIEQRA